MLWGAVEMAELVDFVVVDNDDLDIDNVANAVGDAVLLPHHPEHEENY